MYKEYTGRSITPMSKVKIRKVVILIMKEKETKRYSEKQLKEMDRQWERSGAGSWEMFPPSVYHTCTQEEIDQMTKERKEVIEDLLDQL